MQKRHYHFTTSPQENHEILIQLNLSEDILEKKIADLMEVSQALGEYAYDIKSHYKTYHKQDKNLILKSIKLVEVDGITLPLETLLSFMPTLAAWTFEEEVQLMYGKHELPIKEYWSTNERLNDWKQGKVVVEYIFNYFQSYSNKEVLSTYKGCLEILQNLRKKASNLVIESTFTTETFGIVEEMLRYIMSVYDTTKHSAENYDNCLLLFQEITEDWELLINVYYNSYFSSSTYENRQLNQFCFEDYSWYFPFDLLAFYYAQKCVKNGQFDFKPIIFKSTLEMVQSWASITNYWEGTECLVDGFSGERIFTDMNLFFFDNKKRAKSMSEEFECYYPNFNYPDFHTHYFYGLENQLFENSLDALPLKNFERICVGASGAPYQGFTESSDTLWVVIGKRD